MLRKTITATIIVLFTLTTFDVSSANKRKTIVVKDNISSKQKQLSKHQKKVISKKCKKAVDVKTKKEYYLCG
jgi:hypothetical protein